MTTREKGRSAPDLTFETAAWNAVGSPLIAGLDEAGRGALAGPVTAAAVILPLLSPAVLAELGQVNDSKQLSAPQREALYQLIIDHALAFGIGQVGAADIDQVGIIPATRQAMRQALAQLDPAPAHLLIDGRIRLQTVNLSQESIIRGDGRSLSIAAASILAKVTRDRLMVALDPELPAYGFARHKGYGTAAHLAALEQHGPSPIHRHSFAPLRTTLI